MSAPYARSRFSPELIVVSGCLIALITFGPRASAGLFQIPMTMEFGWGRDVFGLAIAVQNLLWGIGQPFAGAVADRFGAVRVLCVGGLLYAAGLVVMAYATTPAMLQIGGGVLIGFGLSGCSFNLVLGAFGKLLPEKWRPMAFGAGTAAGSFGQFLFPPIGNILIENYGWQQALGGLCRKRPAGAAACAGPGTPKRRRGGHQRGPGSRAGPVDQAGAGGSFQAPLLRSPGARLLHVRFPARLHHRSSARLPQGCGTVRHGRRLDPRGDRPRQCVRIARFRLAFDAHVEALASGLDLFRAFSRNRGIHHHPAIARDLDPVRISIGLLWLSTVPPTSSLVMLMFGTRYMAMLYGFAFFSHQVGGFLGVWLGGALYEAYGNYTLVWWLSVALGIASGLINLPIKEQPVERRALQPAE